MTTVGAPEANTQLPALLKRVAEGEQILITDRGKPIARLVPVAVTNGRGADDAIAKLRALRRGTTLGGFSCEELRDAGRG